MMKQNQFEQLMGAINSVKQELLVEIKRNAQAIINIETKVDNIDVRLSKIESLPTIKRELAQA